MNKKVVFLPYDMDTAIGINNEGALVFGYSLEDTDLVNGTAEVFNGQSSVLWNNLRETFGQEIKDMYMTLRASGNFSYEAVEQAFEEHQNKWPEAVFNEDAYFKYIKPLIEDGDETYLTMLLGSKAEQRKWWLYNRFRYMDSKYNSGDSLSDRILLRGNAPSDIVVTPYADVYISIRWASTLRQVRATRNIAYTMLCPLDSLGDTDLYVYSAGQLSDLGDLSGLMLSFADFHSGIRLQRIKVGSADANYNNPVLRSLNVGNLTLLKVIDARNCSGLGTANDNYAAQKNVDLSGCAGIEEAYFDGTNIGSVSLPNGGFLKKLHLPGTITNLTLRNQQSVTEFVCPDFSHVTTLVLENNGNSVNVANIVQHVATGCRIRISGYRWDFADIDAVHDFLDYFDGMTGVDQNGDNTESPQLFFTAHVPTATGEQIDSILERYPDVIIDADVATLTLRYWNTEGTEVLYTETVEKGQNGTYSGQPSHAPTARWSYVFAGWNTRRNADTADDNALVNITTNRNVYAAYTKTVRTYTVVFRNDNGVQLQMIGNVAWGSDVTYTGETPVHSSDPTNMEFIGFSPDGTHITGDTSCVAQYRDTNALVVQYVTGTIHDIDDDVIATVPMNTFAYRKSLVNVRLAASTIGTDAFRSASALEVLDLTCTGALSFNPYAIQSCESLKALILRSNSVVSVTSTTLLRGDVASIFFGGQAFVYVPDSLLSDYKVHGVWSNLAKRIMPISSYPVSSIVTLNMTLPQIKAAVEDETFFSLNVEEFDTIPFSYGGRNVLADIVKIDPVNKYVDFVIHYVGEKTAFFSSSNSNVVFEDSLYMERLTEIYDEELSSEIQNCITPITQYYLNYDGSESAITAPLWALTARNMSFGASAVEEHGEIYSCFANDYKRVKFPAPGISNLSDGDWGLASLATSSGYQKIISSSGSTGVTSSKTYERGFIFGFRIQKSGGE